MRRPTTAVAIRHGSQDGYSLEASRHVEHCGPGREAHARYVRERRHVGVGTALGA